MQRINITAWVIKTNNQCQINCYMIHGIILAPKLYCVNTISSLDFYIFSFERASLHLTLPHLHLTTFPFQNITSCSQTSALHLNPGANQPSPSPKVFCRRTSDDVHGACVNWDINLYAELFCPKITAFPLLSEGPFLLLGSGSFPQRS